MLTYLFSLLPFFLLYGVGITLIWLGLHYGNGWVIAAGLIFTLMLKCDINTDIGKEEK